jgi:hypothetical protein
VPSCQLPLALHVCVSVPQFPHATLFEAPGVQDPVHVPWLHTNWHAAPLLAHVPFDPHFWGCRLLHWSAPGVHDPAHVPLLHTLGQGDPEFCQLPVESHSCGWLLLHCIAPGRQVPEHAPAVHAKGQGAPSCH